MLIVDPAADPVHTSTSPLQEHKLAGGRNELFYVSNDDTIRHVVRTMREQGVGALLCRDEGKDPLQIAEHPVIPAVDPDVFISGNNVSGIISSDRLTQVLSDILEDETQVRSSAVSSFRTSLLLIPEVYEGPGHAHARGAHLQHLHAGNYLGSSGNCEFLK